MIARLAHPIVLVTLAIGVTVLPALVGFDGGLAWIHPAYYVALATWLIVIVAGCIRRARA